MKVVQAGTSTLWWSITEFSAYGSARPAARLPARGGPGDRSGQAGCSGRSRARTSSSTPHGLLPMSSRRDVDCSHSDGTGRVLPSPRRGAGRGEEGQFFLKTVTARGLLVVSLLLVAPLPSRTLVQEPAGRAVV